MDTYVAIGLVLAALLIAAFSILEGRMGRFPDLVALIQIVLASTGITAGARVGIVACSEDKLGPFKSQDRIYLVLGALALAVVSAQSIVNVFRAAAVIRAAERLKTAGAPAQAPSPQSPPGGGAESEPGLRR